MLSVLCAVTAVACGGAPDDVQDGADTSAALGGSTNDNTASPAASASAPAPSASAPPASSAPPVAPLSGECTTPDQGCACDEPGEVIACKGVVIVDGDYTTCIGRRSCVDGAWGPCISPTTYVHGHSHTH